MATLSGGVWFLHDLLQRPFSHTANVTLSQDKKWVLWFSIPEESKYIANWEAASLDGMKQVRGRFDPSLAAFKVWDYKRGPHEDFWPYLSPPIWRTDGKSWVMVRKGMHGGFLFDLFSIAEQGLVKEIKLPPIGATSNDSKSDASVRLLGYVDGKRMLGFVDVFLDHTSKIEAFTLTDDGDPKSLRQFVLSIPQPGRIQETQLSPTGDKLAWLILTDKSGGKEWNWNTAVTQVWVSSWEGRNWKLQGEYGPNASEKFSPTQIRWLTDGKRLSFLYHQKLWILPAE